MNLSAIYKRTETWAANDKYAARSFAHLLSDGGFDLQLDVDPALLPAFDELPPLSPITLEVGIARVYKNGSVRLVALSAPSLATK